MRNGGDATLQSYAGRIADLESDRAWLASLPVFLDGLRLFVDAASRPISRSRTRWPRS